MLTDIQKQKIIAFNQDEEMVEAVRKVLLASIYSNGTLREDQKAEPLRNAALGLANLTIAGQAVITNEQLGEDLRAFAQGVNALEAGFMELTKIKKDEKPTKDEGINEAR